MVQNVQFFFKMILKMFSRSNFMLNFQKWPNWVQSIFHGHKWVNMDHRRATIGGLGDQPLLADNSNTLSSTSLRGADKNTFATKNKPYTLTVLYITSVDNTYHCRMKRSFSPHSSPL